jgi:hypothetical protein
MFVKGFKVDSCMLMEGVQSSRSTSNSSESN